MLACLPCPSQGYLHWRLVLTLLTHLCMFPFRLPISYKQGARAVGFEVVLGESLELLFFTGSY